jgi:pyruvate, water dikinase
MKDNKTTDAAGSLILQLQERAKELDCFYKIEELLSKSNKTTREIFMEIVEAIPAGWQYPNLCQARIICQGETYAPQDFVETRWVQSARIVVRDATIGNISVFCSEEMPSSDDGPFLKEEAKLIKTIAGQLEHFMVNRESNGTNGVASKTGGHLEENGFSEWRIAIDLIRRTDQSLLYRVSRKMMNHLLWCGVDEAKLLLQIYGKDLNSERYMGESNQPQEKTSQESLQRLSEETFRVAAQQLSDDEIKNRIEYWVHEDKSSFLIKPLVNVHASLTNISDAMQRYQHFKPEGVRLSKMAANSLRVALIRRFFTDQLSYISVTKKFVEPSDFFDLLDRVIYPSGSHGKLGGKSAGLFLGNQVLKGKRDAVPSIGEVKTPKTWYLTSDGLHEFVNYNNLEEVYEQKYKEMNEVRHEYQYIVQVLKNSHFTKEIVKGLSMALDDFGEKPLIVRSSSLLEDRLGTAFSGKYRSLFLANQGDKKDRLDALMDAIAEVYASTFGPDPIEYRAERDLLDFNEQMGIMIQEVVGKKVGKYFFPSFAGVAFSNNEFRWSPRIQRNDGLVRIVPGLGTRAVDRLTDDYPVLVAPGQPGLRVNVTRDEIVRYSPKKMDVINLETNCFETIEVSKLVAKYGDKYPSINRVVSVLRDGDIKRSIEPMTDFETEEVVVTFEGLLASSPFIKQIEAILKTLENELNTPVDIEFASDGDDLYLLQCRAQSSTKDDVAAYIPQNVPGNDVLFTANRYVSNGRVPDITHIVYVDPDKYCDLSDLNQLKMVGQVVGKLNKLLPKRQFILVGPGRWGSRGDIKLGVRVTYSDINNTAMLIEVARKKGNYVPDLSFGTHFFQDLVEASIRYLPLYPDDSEIQFNESFFVGSPNLLPGILPEYKSLANTVHVIDVPQTAGGKVLRVLMNADQDEALGMLADPSSPFEGAEEAVDTVSPQSEDHWRWRLRMVERIAAELNPDQFGVEALYVFGSVKNATAGPGSDIDLLVHFRGNEKQGRDLENWLKGWSLCLDELNYLRTGYRSDGLLDVHIITDKEISRRSSYAVKIGAITDAARKLPLNYTKTSK